MRDLIYRQAAIDLLKNWSDGYDYIEIETKAAIKEFQQLPSVEVYTLLNLPSAEKKGKLLNAHPYGECSVCGWLIDSRDGFNYCPQCGVRLEGEG